MVALIVLSWFLIFVLLAPYVCFHIFLVKFGWLSGHLLGKWLPIRLTICFLSIHVST